MMATGMCQGDDAHCQKVDYADYQRIALTSPSEPPIAPVALCHKSIDEGVSSHFEYPQSSGSCRCVGICPSVDKRQWP